MMFISTISFMVNILCIRTNIKKKTPILNLDSVRCSYYEALKQLKAYFTLIGFGLGFAHHIIIAFHQYFYLSCFQNCTHKYFIR